MQLWSVGRLLVIACLALPACVERETSNEDGSASSDASEPGDADAATRRMDGDVPDTATDASKDASTPADAEYTPLSDATADAGADAAASDAGPSALCPPSSFIAQSCENLGTKSEHAAGLCDGFDNDCNGRVDDGCPCELGTVQPCFPGPPARARIGACGMGTQTCVLAGEFPALGQCLGARIPSAETCDGLDNDCNGCADDLRACVPVLKCPTANDPRVPKGTPFGTVQLDASAFYSGNDVASVHWSVEGSPCDKLFLQIPGSAASPLNGQLSFTLTGENQMRASVRFTLSGTYQVTLDLTLKNGEHIGCTFPVSVTGPGLRVELCWDKTGPTSQGSPLDLDLHLARRGSTVTLGSSQDFFYDTFSPPVDPAATGIWGHPNTPGAEGCLTGDPGLDLIHTTRGNCLNPRLDADNQDRSDRYVAENINLDNPRSGEQFQIAVQHTSETATRTRALVNVYCAGRLRGSFELDPARTAFSDVTGKTEYWHVAQITSKVNPAGLTTDCDLRALTEAGSTVQPFVSIGVFDIVWHD